MYCTCCMIVMGCNGRWYCTDHPAAPALSCDSASESIMKTYCSVRLFSFSCKQQHRWHVCNSTLTVIRLWSLGARPMAFSYAATDFAGSAFSRQDSPSSRNASTSSGRDASCSNTKQHSMPQHNTADRGISEWCCYQQPQRLQHCQANS